MCVSHAKNMQAAMEVKANDILATELECLTFEWRVPD